MQMACPLPRRARGITLIELLTTLAVASVALGVLIPSWSQLTEHSQATTTANRLLAHLRYARNEAISLRQMVGLCPSLDGEQCSGDPRAWGSGYILFQDDDGDRERDGGEPLLLRAAAAAAGVSIRSTAARPAVRFRPDGAAWSTNTSFSICVGEDQAHNRVVVLYGSGRVRIGDRLPDAGPPDCA